MAEASEGDVCDHQWVSCTTADFKFSELEPVIRVVNEDQHGTYRYYPTEMCELCGDTQGRGYGAGSWSVHSFSLVKWEYINHEQEVVIFLHCDICDYDRVIVSDVETILSGASDSCLLGGQCPKNLYGVMYPEGISAVDSSRSVSEEITFSGVIEVPCTGESSHYFIAYRSYCPICGRPERNNVKTSVGELPEAWFNYPMYTEEEFLTVDMPDNLPYQLIDLLRAKAVEE